MIVIVLSSVTSSSWITVGWLEVQADRWPELTRYWGGVREVVERRYKVPPGVSVTATLTDGSSRVLRRARRRQSLAYAVGAVGAAPGIEVASAYASVEPGDTPAAMRDALMRAVLRRIDRGLMSAETHAVVLLDESTTPAPPGRWCRFVEGRPMAVAGSIVGEIAGLVAWTALQYRRLGADPDFCWDVYRDLRSVDVYGEPVAIDLDDVDDTQVGEWALASM